MISDCIFFLGSGVSVSLCLFDSQAVSFHNKLESFWDEPMVTVATSIIRRLTAVLEFHFRNTYFLQVV
ncbi:hypothetical protein Bca4012_084357 [Brassica carinata]